MYVVGLHRSFHGKSNPAATGETFATSVFRVLEELARDNKGCEGLYLRVRSDNARAIAFYRKIGFEPDPAGPVSLDDKSPHLTMRKLPVQSSGSG